jgi:apolipoprotein D and lipocalin family protein
MKPLLPLLCAATAAIAFGAATMPASAQPAPLTALPSLDIPAYMGTWYQVAWFPNRFQQQCVSDTAASYRRVPEGVEVINRCRNAAGEVESIVGLARPDGATISGDMLQPAQLEVSFLPRWLRWLPIWGSYWVIQLADDGRYAVVGEPGREYMWVLSRTPGLAPADESAIRSRLVQQGYDLGRWQNHKHSTPASAPR